MSVPLRTQRGPALAVVIFFLSILGVTGVADLAWPDTLRPMGTEAEAESARRARARFQDGTLMRGIDRDLRLRSRARRVLLSPWAAALRGVFGEVPERCVAGRDGWIFFRSSLDPVPEGVVDVVADRIAALDRRLRTLGVRLVVMPVPVRAEVVPTSAPLGSKVPPGTQRFVDALRQRGVEAIDLLTRFQDMRGRAFFRTDTHWTPEGAAVAARAVVEAAGVTIPEGERPAQVRVDAHYPDAGDLLGLMGIDVRGVPDGGIDRALLEARSGLVEVPIPGFWDVEDRQLEDRDLNGPVDAPVLVLGTSQTAASAFISRLGNLSGRRVHAAFVPGSGATAAVRRHVMAGVRHLPDVLVWEFPMHAVLREPKALRDLGDVFGLLPGSGVQAVPEERFQVRGSLAPGAHLKGGGPLHGVVTLYGLAAPGDGTLGVRIAGGMRAGSARVRIWEDGVRRLEAHWPSGLSEVVLPVCGVRGSVRVTVEGDDACDLMVTACELVWDLEDTGISGEWTGAGYGWSPARSIPRGAVLRVHRDGAAGMLQARVVFEDGAPVVLDVSCPEGSSLLLLPLSHLHGRSLRSVQFLDPKAAQVTRCDLVLQRQPD